MSDKQELPDRLRGLQLKFIERCMNDIPALTAMQGKPVLDPETRNRLSVMAHSLAGAGGTFGFADVSIAAHQVEDMLDPDKPPDDASVKTALDDLIAALEGLSSA